jgi:hypothetical protein
LHCSIFALIFVETFIFPLFKIKLENMKPSFFFTLLFCSLSLLCTLPAQNINTWAKVWTEEKTWTDNSDIIQAIDGKGYIVVAQQRTVDDKMPFWGNTTLIRLDENGNVLWQVQHFVSEQQAFDRKPCLVKAFVVKQQYVVLGTADNGAWAFVFDDTGKKLSEKKINIPITAKQILTCQSVIHTQDKGFMFSGWLFTPNISDDPSCLLKVDSTFSVLWFKKVLTVPSVAGKCIISELPNGQVLLGQAIFPDAIQGWIAQLTAKGDIIWQKKINISTSVGVTPNVLNIFIGTDKNYHWIIAPNYEYITDTVGNLIQTRDLKVKFDAFDANYAPLVMRHNKEVLVALPESYPTNTKKRTINFVKLNTPISLQWTKQIVVPLLGENSVLPQNAVRSMINTPDQGLILTGNALDSNNVSYFWVIKTDSTGRVLSSIPFYTSPPPLTLQVFPNPVERELHLAFLQHPDDLPDALQSLLNDPNQGLSLVLSNMQGQIVKRYSEVHLPYNSVVEDLPSGTYRYALYHKRQLLASHSFLKQ